MILFTKFHEYLVAPWLSRGYTASAVWLGIVLSTFVPLALGFWIVASEIREMPKLDEYIVYEGTLRFAPDRRDRLHTWIVTDGGDQIGVVCTRKGGAATCFHSGALIVKHDGERARVWWHPTARASQLEVAGKLWLRYEEERSRALGLDKMALSLLWGISALMAFVHAVCSLVLREMQVRRWTKVKSGGR